MQRLFTIILLGVLTAAALAAPPAKGKPKHTNRLAREISPYLLQHAHNPVDWYPWGEEAFAKAKKEGKLVFLSIGYSSCHWCHVMEKESFADEETAKILNENFVCIKVDREERPDVDQIYMTALHVLRQRGAIRQGGGWPMSMFLMEDGKPVIGGTYWPREDRTVEGKTIAGFKSILKRMSRLRQEKPKDLREQADDVAQDTAAALSGLNRGAALVPLDRSLVAGAVEAVKAEFDPRHAGFGDPGRNFAGTKFPMPPYLALLQYEAAKPQAATSAKPQAATSAKPQAAGTAKDIDDMVQASLDHMARGGIYDQLGGGFHRYSTERTWTVPHFEKMLCDNAQLLEVYARAFRETKKPLYRRVMRQTWGFIRREMTSPDGGFYSALDADSDGEEGRFYVWTSREINATLEKRDADLFRTVYGVRGEPNFEEKYFILTLPQPLARRAAELKLSAEQLEERLAALRGTLLAVRGKRPRPFLDTKILTGWNGEMIAGAALAGQALGDKEIIAAAVRCAEFLLQTMRTKDGRLLRSYGAAPGQKAEARLPGYLDDYAFLVHGLLNLHDVTGEARWLEEACRLTDTMVEFYGDREQGGFFYTARDHEKLFARAKSQYDGAQPSGNSVAAANLVRLRQRTGDARYGRLAEKTIQAFAPTLKSNPTSLTALAQALAMYLDAKGKNE